MLFLQIWAKFFFYFSRRCYILRVLCFANEGDFVKRFAMMMRDGFILLDMNSLQQMSESLPNALP